MAPLVGQQGTDINLEEKLEELDARGFTVLPGLIAGPTVDRIREEFLRMLDGIRKRDRAANSSFVVPAGAAPGQRFTTETIGRGGSSETCEVTIPQGAEEGDVLDVPLVPSQYGEDLQCEGIGGLQETERYTMFLPWRQPFADPAIYEHPVLMQLLEMYWAADDFRITCMHSNTPYPGSRFQRWHTDSGGEGGPATGRSLGLGVKFPLCDTSEENGSFAVIPVRALPHCCASAHLPSDFTCMLGGGTLTLGHPSTRQLSRPRSATAPNPLHRAAPPARRLRQLQTEPGG